MIEVVKTDTVMGYICDPFKKEEVLQIFKLKKRPLDKNLPIFVPNIQTLKEIAIVNKELEKVLEQKWPGAYTVIVESKISLYLGEAKTSTIAVRMPNNKELLEKLKLEGIKAQTSYNESGKDPIGGGSPSEIWDWTKDKPKRIR